MTQPLNNLTEEPVEEDIFDNLDEDDFVFILDKNGDLKTLLLPDMPDQDLVPEKIIKMLSVLGVKELQPQTIH